MKNLKVLFVTAALSVSIICFTGCSSSSTDADTSAKDTAEETSEEDTEQSDHEDAEETDSEKNDTSAQSSAESEPEETVANGDANGATIELYTLYEDNDISISTTGFVTSDDGEDVHLRIVNNSDKDVYISTQNLTVNGYTLMISGLAKPVDAHQSVNGIININTSDMNRCGIEQIGAMVFEFLITDRDTWSTIGTSETITLQTSLAYQIAQEYPKDGDIIYNDNSITVYSKGLVKDEDGTVRALFYIENGDSENSIIVSNRMVTVNGETVHTFLNANVRKGCHAYGSIDLSKVDGITSVDDVKNISFTLDIFNFDTDDSIDSIEGISIDY